ncbi:HPP family protein [Kordiimonas pumila]|uniref:HPP family protein n=2 Tax=Kordiimonas pumila TaxID=2161677 RepID=A0ABV7D8R0_9PROT
MLRGLSPAMGQAYKREMARAGICASIGLISTAIVITYLNQAFGWNLFLIAPIGATAVLVFAVPNSPLAQPWSAIIGNSSSALFALCVVHVIPYPWSAGIAVGGAIFVMMLVRAAHPPGGAVALLIVLQYQATQEISFQFVVAPVAVTTSLVVALAILSNRITGRIYPFRQPAEKSSPPHQEAPNSALSLTVAEREELLIRFNQSTNLGVEDLGRLLAAAEMEAAAHRFGAKTCADIMTKDLLTAFQNTPLQEIWDIYRSHAIKSIPVINTNSKLIGIILPANLIAWAMQSQKDKSRKPLIWFPRQRLHKVIVAADVMDTAVTSVPHSTPVGNLLNLLSDQSIQVVPVTKEEKLVGIITRSDIIKLLMAEIGNNWVT